MTKTARQRLHSISPEVGSEVDAFPRELLFIYLFISFYIYLLFLRIYLFIYLFAKLVALSVMRTPVIRGNNFWS